MRPTFALLTALLLVPLATSHASDTPEPPVEVTQQMLNAIHTQPKLIFNPFPAYSQKYLPFAMASSIESTRKGRLWTCWAAGEDGPNAFLVASYSDDQGKTWRDPVFVIDPQAHGLKMGTRLGSFWCDPQGRLWLFFHQSVGMFDGSCSNWFVRCDDPDAENPVWSEPVFIGFGASLNKPIVRKNGEWILPVSLWERWHIDKPFADYYRELDAVRGSNVFVSDNEGESWRYRGGRIFHDSNFNEHSVVEKKDGTLWMLSRCKNEAAQSFSTDGGKTWQEQTTFFPHVNSKSVFRRLHSGNILLIRHGEDMTKAAPAREYLTAFLSPDDGKTWPAKYKRVSPAYYRFFPLFAHNALHRVCGTPAFNSLAIHAIVIVVLRLSSPAKSTLSACPFLSLRNSSNPTPRFFKNSRTIPRAFSSIVSSSASLV